MVDGGHGAMTLLELGRTDESGDRSVELGSNDLDM